VTIFSNINQAIGHSVLRLAMGAVLAVAGYTKWAGGLDGFATALGNWGFPLPYVVAMWVASIELVGGVALLLGIFARLVGAYFVLHFLVIIFAVSAPRFGWNAARLDVMMLAAAVVMVCCGGGLLAADRVMKRG
jgi:putative oxidoreductase